jgi:hypothetical protein
MDKNDKKKIGIGIIVGVSVFGITTVLGYLPTVLAWLADIFVSTGSLLMTSLPVPVWLVIILAGLSLRTILSLRKRKSQPVSEPKEPTHADYREDKIFGVRWRWSYPLTPHPNSVWGFCPTCDMQLVRAESGFHIAPTQRFFCENCQREIGIFEGTIEQVLSKVLRQVDLNIRNGNWRNKLKHAENGKTPSVVG